jgi:uncharacterized membrane protein YhaH (DUF805 family)
MDIKINYFIKCMKNYAVFKGRASRPEFWYFILYWIILYGVIIIIDRTIGYNIINLNDLPYSEYIPLAKFSGEVGPLILFYRPLTIIPSIAAATRRLHDINMSGKWSILLITPLAPITMLFLIKKGDVVTNQYGNMPN